MPTQWRPVYRLNGKYFLYNASDGGNNGIMLFTDSTFMPYIFENGYTPIALLSVDKDAHGVYKIKTIHLSELDQSCPKEVEIYIIDKKTKLAVWKIKVGNQLQYTLMVPKTTMRYYPLIVNEGVVMDDEFDFEKIDAEKLLN